MIDVHMYRYEEIEGEETNVMYKIFSDHLFVQWQKVVTIEK